MQNQMPERIATTGDRLAFAATNKEETPTAAPSQALNCLEHSRSKNARPPRMGSPEQTRLSYCGRCFPKMTLIRSSAGAVQNRPLTAPRLANLTTTGGSMPFFLGPTFSKTRRVRPQPLLGLRRASTTFGIKPAACCGGGERKAQQGATKPPLQKNREVGCDHTSLALDSPEIAITLIGA